MDKQDNRSGCILFPKQMFLTPSKLYVEYLRCGKSVETVLDSEVLDRQKKMELSLIEFWGIQVLDAI